MIKKHSINIMGHATSVSLEDAFWQALAIIAGKQGISVAQLIAQIDADKQKTAGGLSSAIRVYVLSYFQKSA